jgi:hypothetical protein
MDTFRPFTFFALALLLAQRATADVGKTNILANDQVISRGIIGAIVDNSSRFGKEQKVAMEMAIQDVNYDNTSQSCVLHIKTSPRKPYQTALAGMYIYIYMCCVCVSCLLSCKKSFIDAKVVTFN